ncbi:MAG: hypothetical protein NC078_12265 [Ruminococcus sp.]|nr:hypothetical protein [Ruminococcus sp.]
MTRKEKEQVTCKENEPCEQYSIWQEDGQGEAVKSPGGVKIIQVSSRLKNFFQQNSPVNNAMVRSQVMNELYGTDVDGQLKFLTTEVTVRSGRGEQSAVYSLCSFSYDDSADLTILNRNGRYKITAYDRRIYNAISTLYLEGRKTVTLTEIFGVMTGYSRTNPSSGQIQAVEKSLNKLRSIRVFIDLTAEVNAHLIKDKQPLIDAGVLKDKTDRIQSAVIEDNMLTFRMGTITSEKGKVTKSIQVTAEPSLLTYNRAKKTLISIPMEYIGLVSSNATEKVIAFQDYLLMRIMSYKNGSMKQNRILYETIYRDSGMEKPTLSKDFIRDREVIKKLLEEWQEKGLITSFKEIKEGRSFVGIEFGC